MRAKLLGYLVHLGNNRVNLSLHVNTYPGSKCSIVYLVISWPHKLYDRQKIKDGHAVLHPSCADDKDERICTHLTWCPGKK